MFNLDNVSNNRHGIECRFGTVPKRCYGRAISFVGKVFFGVDCG